MCILLGTDLPTILRPTKSGEFLVVGSYFVHGMMDGEMFLGPLPNGWRIELYRRKDSGYSTHFIKPTGELTLDDPRTRIYQMNGKKSIETMGRDPLANRILRTVRPVRLWISIRE